jgi:hypothetical protein
MALIVGQDEGGSSDEIKTVACAFPTEPTGLLSGRAGRHLRGKKFSFVSEMVIQEEPVAGSMHHKAGDNQYPSTPPRPFDFPAYGAPLHCYTEAEFSSGSRALPIGFQESPGHRLPQTSLGPSPPQSLKSNKVARSFFFSDSRGQENDNRRNSFPTGPLSSGLFQPVEFNPSCPSIPPSPSKGAVPLSPLLRQQPPSWNIPPFPISTGNTSLCATPDKPPQNIIAVKNTQGVSKSRMNQSLTVTLFIFSIALLVHCRQQAREIDRLHHENLLLVTAQEKMRQSCSESLDSARSEMQFKFDTSSATLSRIHQLELDK